MSAESPVPDGRADFGLIETLLWTREAGFWLVEGHRARMAASASALGFSFLPKDFDAALADACAGADSPALRVRILLSRDGAIEISAAPFAPDPPQKIWRVAVAAQRFDSCDPLLRHKTTVRALYEDAFAASGADEVIFLNEKDEVCEGARTNVFVERDGALLTPPVASGLLPGVLRAHLLAEGRAREKVLRLSDLGEGFLVGNSLRGLLSARLV
ncbi:aminotransferase class IV family protein [Rhodoblastus acidophilus]|uniref:Probable branched-chain-amino-acid aminotransferase n=1 Tax=Candidatus Rhodoblastus alkanivorans TaxID=2954117 RepID=A0ABS9Z5G1_9HYPH|nr:aminotransferase class IV family protein [Candidatus Rhodoblastus alkanivorans]MCI4677518.1 aminotransferase class IV family protein [Candidatus Rhodoblastus alkanivorans]MCI4681877.1 aminotransferase class IV family protein [Candidatus Rhodoblastus alkanivorans]MDI4642927.1 aminotransferase class IV family protein [Rhodoblastus acidophilus]